MKNKPVYSFNTRRTLIPWGFSAEYKLSLTLSPDKALSLLSAILKNLLPEDFHETKKLLNLKGKDPGFDSPLTDNIQQEQLLSISGTAEHNEESLPFQYKLLTRFSEFQKRNIIFELLTENPDSLFMDLSVTEIIKSERTSISSFQLNLEFFSNRLFSYMFGTSPTVMDRIYFNYEDKIFSLEINSEGLASRTAFKQRLEQKTPLLEELLSRHCNTVLNDHLE